MFAYSQEVDLKVGKNAPDLVKEVEKTDFYFGYDFKGPFHPEIGYRVQKDQLGWGLELGLNARSHCYFYTKLGANFYFFPSPDLGAQFFVGANLSGDFVNYSPCNGNKYFTLKPSLFVGRDFFFCHGNRIFAQVGYFPGFQSYLDSKGWEWTHTLGFKLGYGF